MSEVHFEVLKREPMCQYCGEMPAAYRVTVKGKGLEQLDTQYYACETCKQAVENGLHECDYNCNHESLYQMPADPSDKDWLAERLRVQSGARHWDWIRAGCPPLREEQGRIVWGESAAGPVSPAEGS